MFAENCRTERVFVDGHSVFELREIERERGRTVLAEPRETASRKFKRKYKKKSDKLERNCREECRPISLD